MEPPPPAPPADTAAAQHAPRPGQNNNSCQTQHEQEDEVWGGRAPIAEATRSSALNGASSEFSRTFSEVVRAAGAAPAEDPPPRHEGDTSPDTPAVVQQEEGLRLHHDDDDDDVERLALCLRSTLTPLHDDEEVEVILVDPPLGLQSDPLGGYVCLELPDQGDQGVLVKGSSSPSFLSEDQAGLDAPPGAGGVDDQLSAPPVPASDQARVVEGLLQPSDVSDRFLRPLRRIVRIYLRRVAPADRMGNLQVRYEQLSLFL